MNRIRGPEKEPTESTPEKDVIESIDIASTSSSRQYRGIEHPNKRCQITITFNEEIRDEEAKALLTNWPQWELSTDKVSFRERGRPFLSPDKKRLTFVLSHTGKGGRLPEKDLKEQIRKHCRTVLSKESSEEESLRYLQDKSLDK